MAEDVRDVKARLSVETAGEPEAFNRASEAVAALGSAASGADVPLASLTGQLSQVAASVRDLGPAGEAFGRFAEALDGFANAKGLDEQREKVQAAMKAWEEFGAQVPEVLDKSSKAAKEFEDTLERLREAERNLGGPLAQSFEEARAQVDELKTSASETFEGIEGKVTLAKLKINEYADALNKAREAGEDVTGDQVEDLEELQAGYDEALKSYAEYLKAKKEAKRDIDAAAEATQNEGKSINSLGDLASAASPKLKQLLGVSAQIAGAFLAGYAAGEKIHGILNRLTNGAFDEFVNKHTGVVSAANAIERALNLLAGGAEDATRNLETLSNQRRIFESLGLEGFSADVERNAEILGKHALAIHSNQEVLEAFAKSLGLSRRELDAQADSLAKNVEVFRKANPQIDPKAFQDLVKGPIQELLDAYAKLGVDVPKHLQQVADAWGVTTSKTEDAAKKHSAAVKALLQDLTGVVTKTTAELREQASVVSEAVAAINKASLAPEGLLRAQAEVQALVEQFRAAKVEIPASLVAAADKVGVFVAAMERAGGVIPVYTRGTEEAADSTSRLGVSADGTRLSITGLGESTIRAAGDLETGRQSIASINPVAGEAQLSLDQLRAQYGATGRAARVAGDDVDSGLQKVAKGARALAEAGEEAAASGDALEWAKDNAVAAAEPIERAGSAADKLGKGSQAASKGLEGLNRDAGASVIAVKALQGDVDALADTLEAFGRRAAGFAEPILAALAQVSTKTREVKAELAELTVEKGA